MNKLLITLLLLISSGSAFAEMTKVGESPNGIQTYYIDYQTAKKSGGLIKVWTLFDYKKPQRIGSQNLYLSVLSQKEFNCKEELFRNLAASFFSENMRDGEIISSLKIPTAWEPVPPESVIKLITENICKR